MLTKIREALGGRTNRFDRDASNNFDFDVESLENRRLLAGNVDVSVHGDNITIRGDNEDNVVTIVVGDEGIEIGGEGETSIGGLDPDEIFLLDGVFDVNNLKIKMKGGDDIVIVEGVDVDGNLTVHTGSGNDIVVIQGELDDEDLPTDVGRNLKVKTSRGNDVVAIGTISVGKNLSVNTGSDSDIVLVGVEFDELDEVDIELGGPVIVGKNLKVSTGHGDDGAALSDFLVGKNLTVKTGAGSDDVLVGDIEGIAEGFVQGKLSVKTGSGNDEALVNSIEVDGRVHISMGGGEDELIVAEFGEIGVNSKVTVSMGGGNDVLAVFGENIVFGTSDRITLKGNGGREDTLFADEEFELVTNVKVKGFENIFDIDDFDPI